METKDNKLNIESIEKLDEYFLKVENCTYQEFCDIYNEGNHIHGNLSFIDFPKDIVEILQKNVSNIFSNRFIEFLTEENIYDSFMEQFEKSNYSYKEALMENPREINYIIQAFAWEESIEGSDFWVDLNQEWLNLISKL
jgi:hypothetical protein